MANKTINSYALDTLTNLDHLIFQKGAVTSGLNKRVIGKQILKPTNVIAVNSIDDFPTPTDTGDGGDHWDLA